ncbi:MAG: hypothetical protein JOY68_01715 [Candidatus Dormibacteraeota bacterium]|nr:hypothetical protein [Candidatus Dormibacteraeota bacterium]MBV8445513.1 hypothetical protein [Candidatus Dormibacteraeota bacterium]
MNGAINGAIVIALLFLAVGMIAMTRQSGIDVAGPVRNWFNTRDAKKLAQRLPLPETVERTYWTLREYRRDAERYSALGYETQSEKINEPYAVDPIVAQVFAAGRNRYSAPPRRRVPVAHVVYKLRPSPQSR